MHSNRNAISSSGTKRLEIADYFDFIITCDQIGKGKEYPDIYLYAAKIVFADKRNCSF